MHRSAKAGFYSVKGTTEVWLRLKSGALKGLNNRVPGSQSQLIQDCKAYKRQMFIGSQRKECMTVDCNAKNVSPQKIMQMIRMNSYLNCKAALSFSTSSRDDGGETSDQDLFVQIYNHLLRLDLKNYKFHHTVASPEEPPKVDVLIRYDDHPAMWSSALSRKRKPVNPNPVRFPVTGLDSRPKYTLGGGFVKKVFEYNPSENCMMESPTIFRSLNALLMEEIGGKIYVARACSAFHATSIKMEVFDPSSANASWEELPCLLEPINYCCHFVLGHKLYVISEDYKMYCYDTVDRVWVTVTVDGMFKYRFSLDGCYDYERNVIGQPIPAGGKMVSEYITIAFQEPHTVDRDCDKKLPHLFGYLYSKDGCLLAIQNLGAFHEDFIAESYCLTATEVGKFCALAVGSNLKYKSKRMLAVSIFSVTELPMAAQLRDKVPPLASASAVPPPTSPEEHKFLSISVEKHYFFDFERENYRRIINNPGHVHILGAFSVP